MSDYLDVFTEVVSAAGTRTAGTSSDWSGWASRSETMIRNAAGGARSTKVGGAFETYLSRWRPTVQGLATRASNLGGNAVSASHTVSQGDDEGATVLRTQTGQAESQAPVLQRQVNGPF